MNSDLVIIGAGPAGMNAAIYAKRALVDVSLIERNAPGGMVINTYEVENFIGYPKIGGAELAMKMFESVESLGIPYNYGDVKKIEKIGDTFKITTDVEEIEAKAVIYATGTTPRKFNVPGEEKFSYKGISWCAICDGGFYKDQDVIVLGAANSACEEALYLASICKSVTLVARSYIKSDKIVKEKVLATKNIKVIEETTLLEFIGDDKLEGIKVRDNKTNEEYEIHAKGVFEFIGLLPFTDLVKDLVDLDDHGYIIANEKQETKTSGLFVAGDVCHKPLRQIVTAISDGAIAAISASKYLEK